MVDNSILIQAAFTVDVTANGVNDVYLGTIGSSDCFVIADGSVGDDTLNFERWDSLVTHKKIYDGNKDGYIDFGPNGVLDVDRYGGGDSKAGEDQLTLTGSSASLRYLGTKDGLDFVYGDAAVRRDLISSDLTHTVVEGTVGDDAFNGFGGAKSYLYDTALGLNLGLDTITGFGKDDYLVTTHKIFDANHDDIITFGKNGVLDLAAGEGAPALEGPDLGYGGQIDFAGEVTSLHYDHTVNINGSDYYFYTL